jgi:EAL domain
VQVGHDLGIEVVAEGIERAEQLELLRAMGCGLGQGYLVARPTTARGIEELAAAEIGGRPGDWDEDDDRDDLPGRADPALPPEPSPSPEGSAGSRTAVVSP